jgi:hypothetical protein
VVEEVKSHYGRYTESRVGVDILDEDVLNLFLRILSRLFTVVDVRVI